MKKTVKVWTRFAFCATAAMLALTSGCANYNLGTTLSQNLRDVYVPNIRNESGQPGVERELTKAILKEIQREGTLRLVSEDRASTRLDIVVVGYRQDSIRYNRENTGVSEEYRMVLRATTTFTNLNEPDPQKAIILENVAEGDATFLRGTDTITAMQRCLPKAAADLAEQIIDTCVSAW